jgi:hypothetical protein
MSRASLFLSSEVGETEIDLIVDLNLTWTMAIA